MRGVPGRYRRRIEGSGRIELGGRVGAWMGSFAVASASAARPAAAELEQIGYACIWYPEGLGTRESLTNGAVLLGATGRIRVASGITNIWGRDPVAAANGARVLDDAYDGRFLLGLGVSHPRQVAPRGHVYAKPVARMRAFLDAMDDDPFVSPDGTSARRPPVRRVLAALREPMLRLAAERADGAHTFLVPVEHTALARGLLGPGKALIVEQKALLEPDPERARARARRALAWYLDTPNYVESLRALGFGEDDLADGGSDRLVDALVAWGDVDRIEERVREQLDAGADQVAIQPLGGDADPLGLETLSALAPVVQALAA